MDLLPSQEELNAKYRYDSETGILYFKHHRERRYIRCFKTIDEAKEWVSKIWPV